MNYSLSLLQLLCYIHFLITSLLKGSSSLTNKLTTSIDALPKAQYQIDLLLGGLVGLIGLVGQGYSRSRGSSRSVCLVGLVVLVGLVGLGGLVL